MEIICKIIFKGPSISTFYNLGFSQEQMLSRLQWILLATRRRNEHRMPKTKIRRRESRPACGLKKGDKGMAGESLEI